MAHWRKGKERKVKRHFMCFFSSNWILSTSLVITLTSKFNMDHNCLSVCYCWPSYYHNDSYILYIERRNKEFTINSCLFSLSFFFSVCLEQQVNANSTRSINQSITRDESLEVSRIVIEKIFLLKMISKREEIILVLVLVSVLLIDSMRSQACCHW